MSKIKRITATATALARSSKPTHQVTAAVTKAELKATIKAMEAEVINAGLDSKIELSSSMNYDLAALRTICRACLKVGANKGANLARTAYGQMIVLGLITPF